MEDSRGTLCRNRRLFGTLERLRCGWAGQDREGSEGRERAGSPCLFFQGMLLIWDSGCFASPEWKAEIAINARIVCCAAAASGKLSKKYALRVIPFPA